MRTSSMFHRPMRLLAGGSLLVAALVASQAAVAGSIIASKHDLTSATNSTYTATAGAEPCAFCHTPHGASASAQLWNRGAAATASFTLYTSATLNTAAVQPGANSVLCLSCHDGATALDLIINKPGSGGYNASGVSAGYTWTGASGTNQMLATSIANLGTSLANDHPIGVPYCGGVTAGACSDADFKTAALYLDTTLTPLPSTTAGSSTGWWIDTGASLGGIAAGSARDKSDLPLYQVGAVLPRVECATCHEPHNPSNGTFLRVQNTSSNLCTTCHNK